MCDPDSVYFSSNRYQLREREREWEREWEALYEQEQAAVSTSTHFFSLFPRLCHPTSLTQPLTLFTQPLNRHLVLSIHTGDCTSTARTRQQLVANNFYINTLTSLSGMWWLTVHIFLSFLHPLTGLFLFTASSWWVMASHWYQTRQLFASCLTFCHSWPCRGAPASVSWGLRHLHLYHW